MKKITLLLITALLIAVFGTTAFSTKRYSVANGNWNSTSVWSATSGGTGGASYPVAGDTVTIEDGRTVTITADAACNSITMPSYAYSTVNINSGIVLSVSGIVSLNVFNTFNVNAGTLNAGSINVQGGFWLIPANLNITTGTVNVTGNILFSGVEPSLQVITFSGAGTLNVGGTFEADGTLTPGSGTVNFTGDSQTIPPYTYNNLTVSGSGTVDLTDIIITGDLLITGDATVILPSSLSNLTVNNINGFYLNNQISIDTLKFLLGNLFLADSNLTIRGAVVGAADGMSIVTNGTGVVSRTIAAGGSFEFPVGTSTRYNPVSFTSALGGTYTAAIVSGVVPAIINDEASCKKTWTITGTNPANVSFTWNAQDAGSSIDPISCTAWRYNTINSVWEEKPLSITSGSGPIYTTTLNDVASFSPWTIGNGGALPVEMTSFTAVLNGSNALLKWSTATEKNNYGFHIERSAEGSGTWVEVAFVKGAGTSDAPKYYSYEDKNLAPGAYVYRIKQIDNDGTMTIYNPNELPKVDAGKSDGLKLGSNYPNPFNPSTSMQFSVPVTGHASLKVYNVIGQEVAVLFSGTAQAGHYITATFNASRLASGIYFARLQYNGQSLVQRMLMTK